MNDTFLDLNDAQNLRLVRDCIADWGQGQRLLAVFERAKQGGAMTIGVIGGSITEGACATEPERRWANLVTGWWRERFPQTQVRLVNAGIGASGSPMGCHRVQSHVLAHRPDFVVCEYAVNDQPTRLCGDTYEGLIRQILAQPWRPAVALLLLGGKDGSSAQAVHAPVGRHYGLPMAGVRDVVQAQIAAGQMRWEDFGADNVHPNDFGHALCGAAVNALLTHWYERFKAGERASLSTETPLPVPLSSDVFARTAMYDATTLPSVACDRWQPGAAGRLGVPWVADRVGSAIEWEVCGTAISVVYRQFRGDLGRVAASIDGVECAVLDGRFEETWGERFKWELLAEGLSPGPHRLRLEVRPDRAEGSAGHQFELRAVMAAGL